MLTVRVTLIVGMIAAVTALAGAAVGGLGSYMSTREANAHDSERLHAEEVQADRAELRRVLDDAAGSLYVAQRNFARGLLVRAQNPRCRASSRRA